MKAQIEQLRKRFQTQSVLALTLESERVVGEVVRRENGASNVVHSFQLPIGADAVLADPEAAGQQLATELETMKVRERRCVICIPPGWALTTSAEVPEMSSEDLRGFLELRAEREFPISPAEMRLAHYAFQPTEGNRQATLVAVPAARLQAVERMLQAAECRAVSISLGLDRCLPASGGEGALHFLANGNHVDVVIAAGGGIVALRSLAGMPREEGTGFDANGFAREVRIVLGRLPEPLRRQVRQADFSGPPAAAGRLQEVLAAPLERLGIQSRERRSAPARSDQHGAARDTADRYLRQQPVAFEFVAQETNRWQEMLQRFDSRKRRGLLAAGLLLVVLPILTFMVRSRTESNLTSEWEGMRRKVAELEELQQKIRRFRPWFEPAPRSLRTLETIAAAFPEQGDVWAKSIEIGESSKVTCTGFARTQPALMTLLDQIRARSGVTNLQVQQVRGENPVQFSITFNWEPTDES